LIQENLKNLNDQFNLQKEDQHTPKQTSKKEEYLPVQVSATMRLNKKLEEHLQDKSRHKAQLNKSTEVLLGSGGLGKPRMQHTFSPPSAHEGRDLPLMSGSAVYPNMGNFKKINDPLQAYKQVSYSSQASLKYKGGKK